MLSDATTLPSSTRDSRRVGHRHIQRAYISGATTLPSCTKDSTRVGHRHIKRVLDIELAWMRLGIPPYIADYLIAIDSEGKTLIRSPAAYTA